MQTATQKEIKRSKKPIQVYFETDTILAINQIAAQKKIPVAEYIRNTVIKDLKNKPKNKKVEYKTFDLGGPLNNSEIDSIIYDT